MANLPAFYADNITLLKSRTTTLRGNTVSDLTGSNVVAFEVKNAENLRGKNNRAIRIRSTTGDAKGFYIHDVPDVVLLYSVASRTNVGLHFADIDTLNVYNLTAHLCNRDVYCECNGTFRNIALSAYPGNDLYRKSYGFYVTGSYVIDLDYCIHYGLLGLVESGTVARGTEVKEDQILYMDELNDDLTPDYISVQVGAGTENPVHISAPDISGIDNDVTTEETADRKYWYNLIDNSFWDVENPTAAEVSFIKAFQSRVAAASEVANSLVKLDVYAKDSVSMERFAELYPMYKRYENASVYHKRVLDMWMAGQNPATVQAYQNSIGGYNLLPSFFRHMYDYEDGWIVNVSYVGHDNWINGMADLRYGIGIDVLGISTLNKATSAECYDNVMKSVADLAPVRWFLHEEVQPSGYVIFTDMYNGYEYCTLANMVYNDDFNICIDDLGTGTASGQVITPLISTENIATSSVATSGMDVEVSLLDRIWSENISRELYWRQGVNSAVMTQWAALPDHIGGVIDVGEPYVQFKLDVAGVQRQLDYEFQGIALRRYVSTMAWEHRAYLLSDDYMQLRAGDATITAVAFGQAAYEGSSGLSLPKNLMSNPGVAWSQYIPENFRTGPATFRFLFTAGNLLVGDVKIDIQYAIIDDLGNSLVSVPKTLILTTPGVGTVFYEDVVIPEFDNINARQLYMGITRMSTAVEDTYLFSFDVMLAYTI